MDLPPGLTRRGDVYYAKYKRRGKWARKSVGKDLEKAIEAHGRLRGPEEVRPRRPATLAECIEDWLEHQRVRNKPMTIKSSRLRSARVLRYLGDGRADQITTTDINRFIEARRRGGAKASTINCDLRILRAVLRHAVAEGLIQKLPCKVRMLRAPNRRSLQPFRPEEIEKVLAAAEDRVRVLVMIAADSGLRLDEILHLQWRDVDLRERRIHVREKRYARRRPTGELVEEHWCPKSHQAREVYVGERTAAELRQYRLRQRWSSDQDWVLQSRHPRTRWIVPFKAIRHAFEAAGLYEAGRTVHALRHSFATAALAGGLDLETVRETLGHA
ncbi:MAG: tyrosine-type recombinase/integrase, partial [Thermoanaerobaculia bacterium]